MIRVHVRGPRPQRARLGLACALVALVSACRPALPKNADAARGPVELELHTDRDHTLWLSAFRGAPLLVFVFTTYDDASQLALTPIEHVLHERTNVRAIGIAVQPNADQLLPLYREALGVSFPLAYDPKGAVLGGHTDLGSVTTVPTYLLLDAQGRIVARRVGAMNEAELDGFLAR